MKALCFCFTFLFALAVAQDCQESIRVTDMNLLAVIQAALAKSTFSCADMTSLTALSANGQEIVSLEGLEWAVNLTNLSLKDNAIIDLQPLSGLVNLRELYLDNNNIRSLISLENLSQLETLSLNNNRIEHLGRLRNLERLRTLALADNFIGRIVALEKNQGLGKGDMLDLQGNCLPLTEAVPEQSASENTLVPQSDINRLLERGVVVVYSLQKDCNDIALSQDENAIALEDAVLCDDAKTLSEGWVIQGQNGWLFRANDFAGLFNLEPFLEDFLAVKEAFATKGITLVIVLIPNRTLFYADQLPITDDPALTYDLATSQASYHTAIQQLSAIGVLAPDLLMLKSDEALFFKTDHHWTPVYAKLVAQAVAMSLVN